MSSLQWRPGRSETSGRPSPSIAGPWEASSDASVREGNNGGGLPQISKLTPGPRSFAPEAIHTPHSCWRCPGGTFHKAYAPLGNQWCWGRGFYCPPHPPPTPCRVLEPWVRTGDLQTLFNHMNPLNGVSPGASELLGQRLRVRTGAVMWSQAQTSCSVGWRRAQESYLDRCKEQHMEVS